MGQDFCVMWFDTPYYSGLTPLCCLLSSSAHHDVVIGTKRFRLEIVPPGLQEFLRLPLSLAPQLCGDQSGRNDDGCQSLRGKIAGRTLLIAAPWPC
eukprot:scaffold2993_cov114-Skeletonema_menzelii.AAC.3